MIEADLMAAAEPSKKTLLYLHGFASSPGAAKARALRDALAPAFDLVVPDLNQPSFAALSFDAMVSTAVAAANAHPPDVMLGSSLGALVALAAAARGVDAPLLLLAPAVGFAERWATRLPPGDGPVPFHHFGERREIPVHRAFFEETARVDVDRAAPRRCVVIIMGRRDETIPYGTVRDVWDRWAESGTLASGSRYEEIADGDHGLFAAVPHVASLVRELAGG